MSVASASDVTVIVATYERPAWLEQSLRSIAAAAQVAGREGISTRILVVDDSSPSASTREVALRMGVDYVRTPAPNPERTPSAARVFGIRLVRSRYFSFFDDDDVMLPPFIMRSVQRLRAGADVAQQAYVVTDEALRPVRTMVPLVGYLGDMLADHNAVNDFAMVVTDRASDVWDPGLGKLMMFGAWLELAFRGARFGVVREPMFQYRRHETNMSDDLDAEYWATRAALVSRYRDKTRARDGRIPGPSWRLRARRIVAPAVRAIARR